MSMSIREAILAAADAFEANPGGFDYCHATKTPYGATDRACYVGKIALLLGEAGGQIIGSAHHDAPLCRRVMGVSFPVFNGRIRECAHECGGSVGGSIGGYGALAAKALRLYADKYHPAESPAIETGSWSALRGIWQPKASAAPAAQGEAP